jgi:hypothetical protein
MKCVIPGLNVKGNGEFVSERTINTEYRLCFCVNNIKHQIILRMQYVRYFVY